MKKYLLLIIIPALLFLSCEKEEDKPSFNEYFRIYFKIDNVADSVDNASIHDRFGVGFDNEVERGKYYFGRGEGFDLGPNSSISFQLAAAYTEDLINNRPRALDSLKALFRPGEKQYDSIIFCTQLGKEKVEITYQEEDGTTWYSTKLIFHAQHNVEKFVNQPGSKFMITEMKEVSLIGKEPDAVIVKGTFNCILYEFDGNRTKTLTDGRFTCLVGI